MLQVPIVFHAAPSASTPSPPHSNKRPREEEEINDSDTPTKKKSRVYEPEEPISSNRISMTVNKSTPSPLKRKSSDADIDLEESYTKRQRLSNGEAFLKKVLSPVVEDAEEAAGESADEDSQEVPEVEEVGYWPQPTATEKGKGRAMVSY